MRSKVFLNNARVSPKKARLVANSIKNKKTENAITILSFSSSKSAKMLLKLLNSAISNMEDVEDKDNLKISRIEVSGGQIIKRRKIRARGRADLMKRRTSNIVLEILEKKNKKINKPKKEKNSGVKNGTKIKPKKSKTSNK